MRGDATLRPAAVADVAAVAALWHRGWEDVHLGNVPDELVAARTEESFRIRAGQRLGGTIVADVGGVVAGFVMVVADNVEEVYVAREFRGSGVAAAVLSEAERRVRAGGYRSAWLAVVPQNARARRFYRREGWTDEGPYENQAPSPEGPIAVPTHRYVKAV